MAVSLIFADTIFKNRFRGEPSGWLLAVAGEKITATFQIRVGWVALSEEANHIRFAPVGEGFLSYTEVITCDNPVFADFQINDVVDIINVTVNNRTGAIITEKISDYTIRLAGETFVTGENSTCEIIGKTPITAIRYEYGLIENSEPDNFISKIDLSTQKYFKYAMSNPAPAVAMIAEGLKSWQNGTVTIEATGVGTYYQGFKIIHTFDFLPFYLATQFDDLKAGVKPSFFKDILSLKYIAKFEALYDGTNPNRIQVGEFINQLGNTGWFNENFNNIKTNYTIDSIVHKTPALVVQDGMELTQNENIFEIVIKNTTDSPFSNANTKVEVGFSLLPEENEYTDGAKTVQQNFALDKCLLTVGGIPMNGDFFGTDEQIFKTVSAVFISASEIKITGKFKLTGALISRISDFLNQRYLIYVVTQNHTIPTISADRVSLLVEADDFFIPEVNDGLISFVTDAIVHPDDTFSGSTSVASFPGDENIMRSIFSLNKTLYPLATLDFKTLKADIYAEKVGASFNLETFSFDFSGAPKPAGVTFVDFKQNRVFKLPTDDDRRLIRIKRRTDLDDATDAYYEVRYPFLYRWEDFIANSGIDSDFLDNSLPNNGLNNFWHRFNSLGWQIKYKLRLTIDNNGTPQAYSSVIGLSSYDYNANPDIINETIKSYTIPGNILLTTGPDQFVMGTERTRIEAHFEKPTGFIPAEISVVIWAEVRNLGGIAGRTRISSVYDVQAESWFESVDTTPRVKKTFSVGDTVLKAEAVLIHSQIPQGVVEIDIYARIYEKIPPFTFFKLQENFDYKLQEDNVSKKLLE